jgi:hypothetical protein
VDEILYANSYETYKVRKAGKLDGGEKTKVDVVA